jgi:hypothetical protein
VNPLWRLRPAPVTMPTPVVDVVATSEEATWVAVSVTVAALEEVAVAMTEVLVATTVLTTVTVESEETGEAGPVNEPIREGVATGPTGVAVTVDWNR